MKKSKGAVLITGAAKRIGHAIALELAKDGYDIAVHYGHSKDDALQTARQIKRLGRRAEIFRADLSRYHDVSDLIKNVKKVFPNLSILINNASVYEAGKLAETEVELLEEQMDVNFRAPFFLSRDFARVCKRGHIINLLDTRIAKNSSRYLVYTLSKKSLEALTKLAASDLAPRIRVNAIAPGVILPAVDGSNANMKKLIQRIPLRKKGNVGYIISALRYLLENDFVTGQILYVDGGQHLSN